MSVRGGLGITSCLAACAMLISPLAAATGDSFSFAVIADPHISGGAGSTAAQNLQQTVDWVNAHRQQEDIDLVFVVGDIGWNNGLDTAKTILDGLDVPYAPLIGDNEVYYHNEERFNDTFAPVYESLAALAQDPNSGLSNWQKASNPVWNPDYGEWSNLQNFAFDYGGVHFACLDWVPRDTTSTLVEHASLNDFEGGTLPWLEDYLASCSTDKQENIVMMAHHPMYTLGGALGTMIASLAAFSPSDFDQLSALLNDPNHDYADYVYAAYTGHYHNEAFLPEDADPNYVVLELNGTPLFDPNTYDPNGSIQLVPLPGYDLYVLEDTHEDPPYLKLVTVTEGEISFAYDSRTIAVPEPVTGCLMCVGALGGLARSRRRSGQFRRGRRSGPQ